MACRARTAVRTTRHRRICITLGDLVACTPLSGERGQCSRQPVNVRRGSQSQIHHLVAAMSALLLRDTKSGHSASGQLQPSVGCAPLADLQGFG